MKRFIFYLSVIVSLMFCSPCFSGVGFYGATSLIGGGAGALDAIDGTNLTDGAAAYVVTSTDFYTYHLNATSGAAESSPDVIEPDTGAGSKRWILVSRGSVSTAEIAGLAVTDGNIVVADGSTWVAESGDTARISLGVGSTDSPTFVTIKPSGLTDGYFPYHIADATGLGDSNLFQSGANLGLGQTTFGTSAAKVLAVGNGTAPTTSPADSTAVWSADDNGEAGKACLYMRNEAGTSGKVAFANFVKKTNVADAAYGTSALTSDYIVSFTSLTAARAAVISSEDVASGTTTQPRIMIFKDESGSAGTYPITISLENAGTINGALTYVLNTNYEAVNIYLNGTNGFAY